MRKLQWISIAIGVLLSGLGWSGWHRAASPPRPSPPRRTATPRTHPTVAIFCYHDVSEKPSRWAITPQRLEAHLRALQARGFVFMTVSEALTVFGSSRNLATPQRVAVLTFDDGFRSAYTVVFPLIQRYRAKMTVFVYTDWIGKTRTALSWAQLRAMAQSGLVEIASHTVTHTYPRRLRRALKGDAYRQRVLWEFAVSKQVLEQRLGVPIHGLAYPGGQVDETLKHLARAAGYQWAVTINPKFVTAGNDPYALPRFGIERTTDIVALLEQPLRHRLLARFLRR